ncbi:hypothetical protein DX873_09190 [Flagellimonas nanhaiensis]|uniref:Uncharacterized protein n=1 Tax=Flagellimonas nanhaiensis TaxID=2292706 RepID=A0A371JPX9_9FLAO|nr:hypothetical protein DX873_09190 [Allomuricauda nanhaiensis]
MVFFGWLIWLKAAQSAAFFCDQNFKRVSYYQSTQIMIYKIVLIISLISFLIPIFLMVFYSKEGRKRGRNKR